MIEPELAEFLEGDTAQYVGTADADRVPAATRGWGIRCTSDGTVRILVTNDPVTIANLRNTRRVAFIAGDVDTNRTVQLKGTAVAVEDLIPSDLEVRDRYRELFLVAVSAIGNMPGDDDFWPYDLVAVTVAVDALFDQSPGQNAGARVERWTA